MAIVQSGLPWGISDTTTDFAGNGDSATAPSNQWNFYGNPNDFTATRNFQSVPLSANGSPGIPYFAGTSNAACMAQATANGPLAVASLTNLGCYALGSSILIPPAYGSFGTTARGMWRDGGFYNVDVSVTKSFKFKERLTAQFRAEFFNILNHPDFVNPAGGPGGGGASLNPSRAGSTQGWACICLQYSRRSQFQSRARIGRRPRDSVGPEADLLIAAGNFR